ncbi:transporter substrate-binding domain-containing protein [Mesorhizobium sp. M0862]|uniref:transporter substrate-binding domain-containing protein n=1 Tax=Mesorhizobium sp. M0862 TaxID=2957015 RepID=UPI003336824A
MNRLIRMIAAAAALAFASGGTLTPANAGEVWDRVLATKTLTVAAGTNWGPVSHLNDKKELDGYDIDVAKAIAKSLGVQVKFVTPGWDLIAAGNWQGRWDMGMGQMTPTKQRAQKFEFVIYCYVPSVAIVHKDSKATKLSDLDGKVIGVNSGGPEESYANHNFTPAWVNPKAITYEFTPGQLKMYQSNNIAFDDLRLGDGVRLDAALGDDTVARDAIKHGYPLRVLDEPLFSGPGAISIIPGDKEFIDKVAAAVKTMVDDGTLSRLSVKWFGVDYSVEK